MTVTATGIYNSAEDRLLRLSPLIVGLLGISAFLLAGCGQREQSGGPPQQIAREVGETLRLTIVPYEALEKLEDEYTPMAQYLARKLGRKDGRFIKVVDYAGTLAALEAGQVDVAYLSPLPYALATSRMKVQPLAMPIVKGKLTYQGIVFVRSDSPIKRLSDLKGRTMAFGDPTSTSGYLLPLRLLEQNGVPANALKRWYHAGDANVVVTAVENGAADAGAAYENVFEVAYRETPEKTKLMRAIGRTEAIPNGIYVARGDMPPSQVEALKKAFLDMNSDPEGKTALEKIPQDGIVAPDDKMFDGVREKAVALNLDLRSLDKKRK